MSMPVPSCEYEELLYHSSLTTWDGVSKNYLRRVNGPYRSAVPPYIGDLAIVPSAKAAELIAEARVAAARVDQALRAAPYDLPSVLLRSESASSSRIENLTVSAKGVALAQIGRGDSKNAQLNVANIKAMETALTQGSLTADGMARIQHQLVEDETMQGIRTGPVWISNNRYGPRKAAFVPPQAERLRSYIEDLVAFADRNDLDPVLKAFVLHAQFETVHPFADGNGRVGRALIHLVLREEGVAESSCLPLSAGLLADIGAYHSGLSAYRQGDAEPLVCLMAQSLSAAAVAAAELKARMDNFLHEYEETVRARSKSTAQRLGFLLVKMPAVNTSKVAQALGVSSEAASNALRKAAQAGMLTQKGSGRATVYLCDRVLEAVDETCRAIPLRHGAREQRWSSDSL